MNDVIVINIKTGKEIPVIFFKRFFFIKEVL